MDYAIISKATGEERRTLGVLYVPDEVDAHGEFASATELRKGLAAFMRSGDRRLRKQHGTETMGDILGVIQWPFPVEADLTVPGKVSKTKRVTLPPETIFMDVQWSPEAWPLVKSGAITGYSMGGRAVRVRDKAAPVKKSSGSAGLVSTAIRKVKTAPSPNVRIVIGAVQ